MSRCSCVALNRRAVWLPLQPLCYRHLRASREVRFDHRTMSFSSQCLASGSFDCVIPRFAFEGRVYVDEVPGTDSYEFDEGLR